MIFAWYYMIPETLEMNVTMPRSGMPMPEVVMARPVAKPPAARETSTSSNLVDYEQDDDRERPMQERDPSDWLQDDYRDPMEEYAFAIDFYERASSGDQYW
jgi:hypothetical protein